MASTSSLFQTSGNCRTRFEKNQQYRNYEPLVRDIWPGIIYKIKGGIDIDLRSSEPFSGKRIGRVIYHTTFSKMTKFKLFAIVLTLCALVSNAEPPPGPRDIAKCPVTGTQISIGDDTPA